MASEPELTNEQIFKIVTVTISDQLFLVPRITKLELHQFYHDGIKYNISTKEAYETLRKAIIQYELHLYKNTKTQVDNVINTLLEEKVTSSYNHKMQLLLDAYTDSLDHYIITAKTQTNKLADTSMIFDKRYKAFTHSLSQAEAALSELTLTKLQESVNNLTALLNSAKYEYRSALNNLQTEFTNIISKLKGLFQE